MTLIRNCGPEWLDDRLAAGKTLIIDGAMGSELQARGVPMHGKAWSGAAVLTHPGIVRRIHMDYIRAGARVIIANTFASGRHMLEPAGLGDQVEKANRLAVDLAKEARDQAAEDPVAIAGSLCEWAHDDSQWVEPAHLHVSLKEQALLLAEAGVDLIALEMCESDTASHLAVEAALETGLPVWLGLSCRRHPEEGKLVSFDPPHIEFEPLVRKLTAYDVAMVNLMHSPFEDTGEGLKVIKRHWQGPLGAYPESGYFKMPNWQFVDIIEPDDLVHEAKAWLEAGVQMLGGCCGLGPNHVQALHGAFA